MTDRDTGAVRVRCERGHFVANIIGHIKHTSIGAYLTGVTGDCGMCGVRVPVVQTFDGEDMGWAWEDVFGDWDGTSSND